MRGAERGLAGGPPYPQQFVPPDEMLPCAQEGVWTPGLKPEELLGQQLWAGALSPQSPLARTCTHSKACSPS